MDGVRCSSLFEKLRVGQKSNIISEGYLHHWCAEPLLHSMPVQASVNESE